MQPTSNYTKNKLWERKFNLKLNIRLNGKKANLESRIKLSHQLNYNMDPVSFKLRFSEILDQIKQSKSLDKFIHYTYITNRNIRKRRCYAPKK